MSVFPELETISKNRECGRILPHSFFERNTVEVARDLLGQEICREIKVRKSSIWLRARVVETEAYLEKGDPAAHCSRGPTPRAKVMFGEAGVIYVYFIYGNYFMLNFVTEKVGMAGAVLIRAVEPLDGISVMARNRGHELESVEQLTAKQLQGLTNGPAKLVQALGVNGSLNGKPLGFPHLAVCEGLKLKREDIVTTTRIGISAAKDLPLRFYERGNPFVSKK